MKKLFILITIMILFTTGCGKVEMDDVISDFKDSVESSKSYKLNGVMEISNGEETFTYDFESYHLKDDYYKVILVNQTNNHEQIILKNDDGLYVVTPSLNKSFKFDSVWPQNSSQAYLLGNLLDDIESDNATEFEETDESYIIKSTVNYPNNEELSYQKIYFDKDMNIQKVEVYSKDDIVCIKVTFKSVDLKAKLSEDDFLLEDLIDEEQPEESSCTGDDCTDTCEGEDCEEETTSALDSIIYPLYIPSNTYLSSSESIDTDDGSRVILTFSGDTNFVIVEETVATSSEFEVIPVYGDPLMLDSTIAAMSTNSISFLKDNISYYIVSSDASSTELVSIASSLGNSTAVISTK